MRLRASGDAGAAVHRLSGAGCGGGVTDALGVIARWSTDRGPVVTRGAYQSDLATALQDQANDLESKGLFVVRLIRCYTQTVPVVDGQPAWALAEKPERVDTKLFQVQHADVI